MARIMAPHVSLSLSPVVMQAACSVAWHQCCYIPPNRTSAHDGALFTVPWPSRLAFSTQAASTTARGSMTCISSDVNSAHVKQGEELVCYGACLEIELAGKRGGQR